MHTRRWVNGENISPENVTFWYLWISLAQKTINTTLGGAI
jgi:hypothetical protein